MRRLPLLFLLVLAVGCDSYGTDDPAVFDAQAYVGTYQGSVLAASDVPDGPTLSLTPLDVVVAASGGSASVTLDIEDQDPRTFAGTYTEAGAVFALTDDGSTLQITIGPDGRIGGGGVLVVGALRFEVTPGGRITDTNLGFTLSLLTLTGNEALPVGTRTGITIGASRDADG